MAFATMNVFHKSSEINIFSTETTDMYYRDSCVVTQAQRNTATSTSFMHFIL